jgi:hypothetical protein
VVTSRAQTQPSPAPEYGALLRPGAWLGAGFCLDGAKLLTELLDEDLAPTVLFLGILSANVAAHDRATHHRAAGAMEPAAPFDAIDRRPVSTYRLARNLDLPYETARRHVSRLVTKGACLRDGHGLVTSPKALFGPAADVCREAVWRIAVQLRADLQAHDLEVPPPQDPADPHEQRRVARLANEVMLAGLRIATETTSTDLVTSLIFLAIYRANHAGPQHDPTLRNPGLRPGEAGPEWTWKPVSIYRVSQQMRMPYETVRRHAGILLGEGLCAKAPGGGLIVPITVLESQAMVAASIKSSALLVEFVTQAFGPIQSTA